MVSIILPNYNHAPFLRERIDSILSQTFQDFELIILDDVSTDHSKEIINSYSYHPKISHIIFNKENSGSTFKQWKLGLQHTKYNIVWIAESDDYADKNFLQNAVQSFSENNDLTVFFCNSLMVDHKGKSLKDDTISYASSFKENIFLQDFLMKGTEFVEKILFYNNIIQNASAVVFKKDYAEDIIDRCTSFKMCGDWLFWILLLRNGNIFYTSKQLNFFRKLPQATRNHNTIEKKRLRIYEEMQVIDELIRKYNIPKYLQKEKAEKLIFRFKKNFRIREFFSKKFLKISKIKFLNHNKFQLLKFAINKK